MRSFDFEVVTRLLDLVAAHFDNVVIDVPRTWFAWTDSVLIGSNRLFLVTEMTVPGLKHARHLVNVIRERLRRRAARPKSSSTASSSACSDPACAAPTSSRRSATRSPARSRTISASSARRSTAACRSTR